MFAGTHMTVPYTRLIRSTVEGPGVRVGSVQGSGLSGETNFRQVRSPRHFKLDFGSTRTLQNGPQKCQTRFYHGLFACRSCLAGDILRSLRPLYPREVWCKLASSFFYKYESAVVLFLLIVPLYWCYGSFCLLFVTVRIYHQLRIHSQIVLLINHCLLTLVPQGPNILILLLHRQDDYKKRDNR